MEYIVFDVESDGLLEDATKIYVLSYLVVGEDSVKSLYTREDIESFITNPNIVLIGHNIIDYDIPLLKKLYNIEPINKPIDTLMLSKYLLSYRKNFKHGLEAYGERFKIPKVKVSDWKEGSIELYTKRCERDVEINMILYPSL